MSPNSFVDNILAHPDLLLINKGDSRTPCHEWEGRVAQIFTNKFYITSPNSTYIPIPPVGDLRPVILCSDGSFGLDDPYIWPQQYIAEYPHLCCVPSRADSDVGDVLYWTPSHDDFVLSVGGNSLINHPGLISPQQRDRLRVVGKDVRTRTAQCWNDPALLTIYPHDHIVSLHDATSHWMRCLDTFPSVFHDACIFVKEYQRRCLELIALLTYTTNVAANISSFPLTIPPPLSVHGTFTSDINVARKLSFRGIPVWLIREISSFNNIRIDSLVEFTTPPSNVTITPLHPDSTPIFYGKSSHPDKLIVISKFASDYFTSLASGSDPTAYIKASRPTLNRPAVKRFANTNAEAGPSTKVAKKAKAHHHESMKPDGTPRFVNPDQFKPVSSPYMPSTPAVWSAALEAVDRTVSPSTEMSEDDRGFALPPPTVFFYLEAEPATRKKGRKVVQPPRGTNTDKLARAYVAWLKLKPALLSVLRQSHGFRSVKMSRKDWKEGLQFEKEDRKTLSELPYTQALDKRLLPTGLLRDRFAQAQMSYPEEPTVSFYGTEISPNTLPSLSVMRKVIWETCELGWRIDLHDLDAYKHIRAGKKTLSQLRQERETRFSFVNTLFSTSDDWTQVVPEHTRQGLTATEPEDRRSAILTLAQIMSSWQGVNPEIVKLLNDGAEGSTTLLDLEDKCARFFTQSFFIRFGRAPLIPRYLD